MISDGCDYRVWDCESFFYDFYEFVFFVYIIECKLLFFFLFIWLFSVSLWVLMDKDDKMIISCV